MSIIHRLGMLIFLYEYIHQSILNYLSGNYENLAATIDADPPTEIGGNFRLTCVTTGPPIYAIHWWRENSLIRPSCKYSINSISPDSSVLTIHNVSQEDAVLYQCIANSHYTNNPAIASNQSVGEFIKFFD